MPPRRARPTQPRLQPNPIDVTAIWPTLWMGGHPDFQLEELAPWDVVAFCAKEYQPRLDSTNHIFVYLAIDDDQLSADDKVAALRTGAGIAEFIKSGARCLVTCNGGLNRSGLICAIAMWKLDMPMMRAIDVIREARGPDALSNRFFVSFLRSLER